MNRRGRRQHGVAAVEFAVVLPVLMLILLGIMDYGHVFMVQLALTNAAREGARAGVTQSESQAPITAKAVAEAYLTNAGITFASNSVAVTSPSPSAPEVTVTITIDPYAALIGYAPTPTSLSANSTMRWELQP